MAKSKSSSVRQTNLKIEVALDKLNEIVGKMSKSAFARIIETSKQNLGSRISYEGLLHYDEVALLLKYMIKEGYANNAFYAELSQIVNPVRSRYEVPEISSECNEDDAIGLRVRGEVALSCGYGVAVYSNDQTGVCQVSRSALRQYGASISSTEIVYAEGDSMSPEINPGDALLVDTSQTEIINGVVYAFNYEGQPMCKRLQRIGDEIKAISKNPLYDPFIIDYTKQFNIIGRVVGFMRQIF